MMSRSQIIQNLQNETTAQWMLKSGIQNIDPSSPAFGGVNAWLDLTNETYPFIYGEITGYAINMFLHNHHKYQDPKYLDAAKLAADWIINNRIGKSKLVLNRLDHQIPEVPYFQGSYFVFDQMMIIYGLAELADVAGDEKYIKHAEELSLFLIEKCAKQNGSFFPMYNESTGEAEEKGDKWSRQAGGYHAKGLMALLKVSELTLNKKIKETAQSLYEWTLNIQENDGQIITQDNKKSTHLHPFLYTLEGMLYYGVNTKSEEALNYVEKSIHWIFEHKNNNHGIFCFYENGEFRPFERVDTLAQLLRVASALYRTGRLKSRENEVHALASHLLKHRINEGAQKGAYFYGQEENGKIHYHANCWVSMFASQAIDYYLELDQPFTKVKFFV